MISINTYNNKRSCLHCSTKIADQAHASTKFCPRKKLGDGTIQSCKDDFHSPKRKSANLPYKRIADYHKDAHRRIKSLLSAKGDTVSVEQINQYGIRLNRPVEFAVDSKQAATYYFVEFAFSQLNNNQFKIISHGRLL
jgi:hypothetical protein